MIATQASRLAQTIRNDIVSGELRPGQHLTLNRLCARYNAGAIPLREALSRLVATGLVHVADQQGFYVASTSLEQLIDLTRTRERLECIALRDSIENGGIEWEVRIVSAHHRLVQCQTDASRHSAAIAEKGVEATENAHREFHLALVSGCGSPCLLGFIETLFEQTARYRRVSVQSVGASRRNASAEHKSLFDACIRRDADRAESLLRQHLQRTLALIRQLMVEPSDSTTR